MEKSNIFLKETNASKNGDLTFPKGNFSADRWGNLWSEKGLRLAFGDGEKQTTVALEPATAKALAKKLHEWIENYETASGTLWSEFANKIAVANDRRLFGIVPQGNVSGCCQFPTANLLANRLYFCIRSLPLDGCERSFKMRSSELLDERFLAGLACSQIALQDVEYIATSLQAPQDFLRAIQAQWQHAQFFHIGFEQGFNSATYKLYLEFSQRENRPLYIGYKWNPENPLQCSVSQYSRLTTPSGDEAWRDVLKAFYRPSDSEVLRIAYTILQLANQRLTARNEGGSPLLVEVHDTDTSRKSFDLNLYESGLRIADITPLLKQLGTHLGLQEEKLEELLKRTEADFVGHISGGIDRHGSAFLTTYHAPATDQEDNA